MSGVGHWKSPILSHWLEWIHLELTSIGWGTIQKSHDFNTISHSIDRKGRAGLEFLMGKILTQVFIQEITMLPGMIADDVWWDRAISTKTQVFNEVCPFSSLRLPIREHGADLFPNFHKWKAGSLDDSCVRPLSELFTHASYKHFDRIQDKKKKKKMKKVFRKQP